MNSSEAHLLLERLLLTAQTGGTIPAESKFNLTRARFLDQQRHVKSEWKTQDYFRKEWKLLPQELKDQVEAERRGYSLAS